MALHGVCIIVTQVRFLLSPIYSNLSLCRLTGKVYISKTKSQSSIVGNALD